MDIRWIIEENVYAVREGNACGCAATEAILTALSMSELETIKHYQDARKAVVEVLAEFPKDCDILCRMIDKIIADEQNHVASLQKAAAACAGNTEPKAEEYNKAVSESDQSAI